MIKTFRTIDFNDIPFETNQYLIDFELGEDQFLMWTVKDEYNEEPNEIVLDDWLIEQGCNPQEKILILYR